MTLASLMLLVLGGLGPEEPTPQELVAKLGSDRFATRLEAALTLRSLGHEALPALRAGCEAADPAIRRRVVPVIEAIERQRLIRPTTVRLDVRDRPLAEVVAAVRDQSGFPVVLEPEGDPAWRERRISLEVPEPVPFWEALDRIGRAGGVRHNPGVPFEPGRRTPRVPLIADDGPPLPTAYTGPFRVNLIGLSRHRRVTPAPAPAAPQVHEQFTALIQVFAEPDLVLDRNGPPRLLEAVDDRGQDLRRDPDPEPVRRSPYGRRFDQGELGILQVRISLTLPADPGRRIERLRGDLPIMVRARTADPLVVALDGAGGRSASGPGVTLTVSEIERQGPNASIRLTLRREDQPAEDAPFLAGLRQDGLGASPPAFRLEDHIQIRDARGRICWWNATRSQPGAEDQMETWLTVYPTEPVGPPVELRYHGVVGAATKVPFEFTDLPMP